MDTNLEKTQNIDIEELKERRVSASRILAF